VGEPTLSRGNIVAAEDESQPAAGCAPKLEIVDATKHRIDLGGLTVVPKPPRQPPSEAAEGALAAGSIANREQALQRRD
jgi:hypothetical protein